MAWKSRWEGGGVKKVWKSRWEGGGSKNVAIHLGNVDFFWNNPLWSPPAVRIIQENLFCWFSLVTSVFTVGLRPFSNF